MERNQRRRKKDRGIFIYGTSHQNGHERAIFHYSIVSNKKGKKVDNDYVQKDATVKTTVIDDILILLYKLLSRAHSFRLFIGLNQNGKKFIILFIDHKQLFLTDLAISRWSEFRIKREKNFCCDYRSIIVMMVLIFIITYFCIHEISHSKTMKRFADETEKTRGKFSNSSALTSLSNKSYTV